MRRIGLCCVAMGMVRCQPAAPTSPDSPCNSARPEPGVIVVSRLACEAQVPTLGEGDPQSDQWLATNQYRVVIRHPQDALTARGLGGATIVDAAPWPGVDTVHEVIPIVGGGWLVDVSIVPEEDGYTVDGLVAALPDREPTAPGERRTVRYRADPDGPFLTVEGAEGFWVHPLGDEVLYDGLAHTPSRVVGAVGEVVDRGGVFEVLGTDRLVLGLDSDVWTALAGDVGQRASGYAQGAEEIVLLRDQQVVGRVPIVGPAFDLWLPDDIDAVRSEATGHSPSVALAPSNLMWLVLGDEATTTFVPVWEDGRPHWFSVAWTAADGRSGRDLLGPEGGELALGAGTFDVVLSAGPAFDDVHLHLELRADEERTLPVRLPTRVTPGSYVLAGFRRPSDRSRDWRGGDLTAAALAAAEGLSYVTFTPPDDVSGVTSAVPGFPQFPFRNGVLRVGDGYTIAAWPWSASTRKAMHGAPVTPPRSALDEAAAMTGGPGTSRTLNVDVGWLAAAGPPSLALQPDQVWLDAPDVELRSWRPWFDWLDVSRPVVPTGPFTWVRVEDPLSIGTSDVEQSLARGDVVAGTGPRIALLVDGLPPGEVLPLGPDGLHIVLVGVEDLDGIDRLALVTDGGVVSALPVVPFQQFERSLDGHWVLVAAWSTDGGGPWAVTGPVWLGAP